MSATIRPMTIEDFAQVYQLGLRCYNVLDKPYNYWSIEEVAEHLATAPKLCYVAEADGRVVGFALGSESYEILENTGHIEWIAVAPEARRQGVASELLNTLVRVCQELGKAQVVTDISSANVASRGMAARNGFREGISVTFFVKDLAES
jgi:ribosomal protein S18 acetylase RimI-like enzyme